MVDVVGARGLENVSIGDSLEGDGATEVRGVEVDAVHVGVERPRSCSIFVGWMLMVVFGYEEREGRRGGQGGRRKRRDSLVFWLR